mmetsp:Transcript_31115/g.52267  ORF Transcript_31115/g.52267 Transcript_31115/m.52267 type:complete len:169 (-) Transcript_31115:1288-1794(-)|eukprot:CAMPEP_0198228846 /NCGR_PEP_ID=MMETSP1445-20131203/113814_1 /TAXON_ID=36898 /ORGANISM="Pyramimonas sp., Strain CCMP2087" /LENGTH=168 /DNA_ID=CAMNT_0043909277 /DNA_START=2282 /DNA_END=2788 /DNA_ORIENTATION=+
MGAFSVSVTLRRFAAFFFCSLLMRQDLQVVDAKPTNMPKVMCNNCKLVARAVEMECAKLEPKEEGNVDDLIGSGRPRRRMQHGRSELKIRAAIEGTCDELGKAGGTLVPEIMHSCWKLLREHGESLGDVVYSHGPRGMVNSLCADLTELCPREPDISHFADSHMDGEL